MISGTRRVMDVTRLTQWGSWEGTISLAGQDVPLGVGARGIRDRSWGQRGVGVQAPTNFPQAAPQVFWLWAPLHFDQFCTHLALFERADGERWLEQALILPVLDPDAATWGPDLDYERLEGVDYELDWTPGTRVARSAALTMRSAVNGSSKIELEPLFTFRMRGIGYGHPVWGHGSVHGPLAVGGESVRLDDVRSPGPHGHARRDTVPGPPWTARKGSASSNRSPSGTTRPRACTACSTATARPDLGGRLPLPARTKAQPSSRARS